MSESIQKKDTVVDQVKEVEASEEKRAKEIFEQFEGFALKNAKQGLNYNNLTSSQVDRLFDLMQQNEKNVYQYHTQKLTDNKEITLANINSKKECQPSNNTYSFYYRHQCYINYFDSYFVF